MSIPTAVLGASGYSGAELLRLLADHPEIDVQVVTAETQADQNIGDLYAHIAYYADLPMRRIEDSQEDIAACGLVFSGLPHGESMRVLPQIEGGVVVDLSGDFRLDDQVVYERWYGREHSAGEYMEDWTYGLPELFRDDIRESDRIASPGCYPTAAVLAIAPLIASDTVQGVVVVDAVSGTSGAGRTPKPNLHFAHVAENFGAYRIAHHQHTPEIEYAVALATDRDVQVSFTAHLAPMVRGIHATVSAQLRDGVDAATVHAAVEDAYADEEFVVVQAVPPSTKQVRGSNLAVLHVVVDERVGRVIVAGVIDNLVKGAAGQAIQNANIALGFDEGLGLPVEGVYP
ncbi:MAG: N-acetyl-gamma-glutamyl-phosphate reductase [Acidimicrobiia bacterium]|nr:N-acetyl-gamma-glutamyl-phosphate reductase [Acidimicrobiia bacterium]